MQFVEKLSKISKLYNIPYEKLLSLNTFINRHHNNNRTHHANRIGCDNKQYFVSVANEYVDNVISGLSTQKNNIFYSNDTFLVDDHTNIVMFAINDDIPESDIKLIREATDKNNVSIFLWRKTAKNKMFLRFPEAIDRKCISYFGNNEPRYLYALSCSDDTLESLANDLQERKVDHYVDNVLTRIEGVDNISLAQLYILCDRQLSDTDRSFIMQQEFKLSHLMSLKYDDSMSVSDVCSIITQTSIHFHRDIDPSVDPVDVYYDIISDSDDLPVILTFTLPDNGSSDSDRILDLITDLYLKRKAYLSRNSWTRQESRITGKKSLLGGNLLIKTSELVTMLKKAKIYGCSGSNIKIAVGGNLANKISKSIKKAP